MFTPCSQSSSAKGIAAGICGKGICSIADARTSVKDDMLPHKRGVVVYETQRSAGACRHLDTDELLTGSGPVSLFIPANTMRIGRIVLCGSLEPRHTRFVLAAAGLPEPHTITLSPRQTAYIGKECLELSKSLDASARALELELLIIPPVSAPAAPAAGKKAPPPKLSYISYIRTD